MKKEWHIGIDEVGRGALAGPVTVGVFAVHANNFNLFVRDGHPLRDSKQLSPRQREEWVKYINALRHQGDVWYVLHSMSHKKVDVLNVAQAANWAATHGLRTLITKSGINPKSARVYLDGGLYLKSQHAPKFKSVETIIKADEKIPAVMLASIVAKVSRDKKLVSLHKKYPHYGFAMHKGYGTKVHMEAIKAHGISDVHRLTFTRKWGNLNEVWHEQVITQNQK